MKTLEQLKAELETARQQAWEIEEQIRETSDGFKYLTRTLCYGSVRWQAHLNSFCANEIVSQYNGDNGIVDLYTTNPDHGIDNYSGDVVIVSEEDILNMATEDKSVSATQWLCNWVIPSNKEEESKEERKVRRRIIGKK